MCPTCRAKLTAPDTMGSCKMACPTCGQKMMVPTSPSPLPLPTDRTKLALPMNKSAPAQAVPLQYPVLPIAESGPPVAQPSAWRQNCKTCGAPFDVSGIGPGKGFACPNCGQEYLPKRPRIAREVRSDDWAERDYDGPRRKGFRCPYCQSKEPPRYTSEITMAGWILFAVLLIFFFPVCFIPLLCMKERKCICYDCGMKIG
jgi:DNA-directed RNA polymerase subunit RPC12/RpoP